MSTLLADNKTDTNIKTDVLAELKYEECKGYRYQCFNERSASGVLTVDNQLSVKWFGYDT
jgi:hypothetical protein